MNPYEGKVICRGSVALGTACGRCAKCAAEGFHRVDNLDGYITEINEAITLPKSAVEQIRASIAISLQLNRDLQKRIDHGCFQWHFHESIAEKLSLVLKQLNGGNDVLP